MHPKGVLKVGKIQHHQNSSAAASVSAATNNNGNHNHSSLSNGVYIIDHCHQVDPIRKSWNHSVTERWVLPGKSFAGEKSLFFSLPFPIFAGVKMRIKKGFRYANQVSRIKMWNLERKNPFNIVWNWGRGFFGVDEIKNNSCWKHFGLNPSLCKGLSDISSLIGEL